MNDKNTLREHYKKLRRGMQPDEKNSKDAEVADRVLSLDEYKKCSRVLVYVATDIEVGTKRIIEQSFKLDKTVLAPRCVANTNKMDFYVIKSFDDLKSGSFGILEPDEKCEKIEHFEATDCCFVPALSYDKNGYRLGFGKGFYDRFLERFCGKTIGLCYHSCVADKLPYFQHDKAVDLIVTDEDVINIKDKKG